MNTRRLTTEEGQKIVELYKQGKSYRDIQMETGYSTNTITRRVRGLRNLRDSQLLAITQGKRKLSEKGRTKLSENGKRSCQRSGKYYTKPERCFKTILNEIGIGVKFPEYIKEIKAVVDDENQYCLLYQYPVEGYVVDYLDYDKKIVININGDYWHGNPLLYDRDNLHFLQKTNVRQDKNKKAFLEGRGWKIIDIWESEIYWNKTLVIQKLEAVGIMGAHTVYTRETGVQFPYSLPEDWSNTLKRLWFKTDRKPRTKAVDSVGICECGKEFTYQTRRQRKYCSQKCCQISHRKPRPTKEELMKLVDEISMVKIGKMYQVSDVTIKKWCKEYDINLGNRLGYWLKRR